MTTTDLARIKRELDTLIRGAERLRETVASLIERDQPVRRGRVTLIDPQGREVEAGK